MIIYPLIQYVILGQKRLVLAGFQGHAKINIGMQGKQELLFGELQLHKVINKIKK